MIISVANKTKTSISQMQSQRFEIDINNAKNMFDLIDCSQATKSDYKARIGGFISYLENTGGLTKKSLIDYKDELANNHHISVSSKNKALITAKRFLQICFNAELIDFDACKDIAGREIRGFSQSQKHKKHGLTSDEVEKICEYMQGSSDLRLKAILSLLIYQGLRRVEIIRLDVSDFDALNLSLMVRGKGSDDKEPIRLHQQTATAISQYLKFYKLKTGAIFTSKSNNSDGERLTGRSLYRLVKSLLKELNIDKDIHSFRHFFVTQLIDNGFEIMQTMKLSRHKSLPMMQVYYDESQSLEFTDEMLNSLRYKLV